MTTPELEIVATTPAPPSSGGCGCGGCGCAADPATAAAGLDAVQAGDLDARSLPHGERHARILEAVAALEPGESFVLADDHDPARLRGVLETAEPGQVTWTPLAQGPDVWRVRIGRVAGHCC